MQRAEDYQAYLRQIVTESRQYGYARCLRKIIESFFWACRANKNTIINGADLTKVLQSLWDPKCKAWKLKLNGKDSVDLTSLVDNLPIAPQTASQMVSMKPEEGIKLIEEEISGKTPQQIKAIKTSITNICKSQALVHRHAAGSAEYLASLTEMVSLPIMLKVMNATMRPVIAVKISEVDEMIEQAQAKVDAIRKAKEATQGLRPIDEVIFTQNVLTYNPEWQHSREGRATSYLAICRYMNELQRKDQKLVLSVKALETYFGLSLKQGRG